MKIVKKLAGLSLAVLIAGPMLAQDLTPMPIPAEPGTVYGPPMEGHVVDGPIVSDPIAGGPIINGPVYVDAAPEPLFQRVKYVDRHEMHPCAVPKIISVNDPCACRKGCDCCGPKCVYIEICVPPCGCEKVKCRRHGDRVRYDYGKYAVDVRVKKGFIVVDYQR